MWTGVSLAAAAASIAMSTQIQNEVLSWVFLIANIITLFFNLGLDIYKRIRDRDKPDVKPIYPPTPQYPTDEDKSDDMGQGQ